MDQNLINSLKTAVAKYDDTMIYSILDKHPEMFASAEELAAFAEGFAEKQTSGADFAEKWTPKVFHENYAISRRREAEACAAVAAALQAPRA